MGEVTQRIVERAGSQRFLITRGQAIELGATEKYVRYQVKGGRWQRIHPGVFQIDRRPLDWESRVLAAVLACGPEARVSHRAALMLWGMDGISSAPVEVTMPFGNLAIPDGVIVHRSRRQTELAEVRGIPVSGPERTLLECSLKLGPMIIGKALDSALRMNITNLDRMWMILVKEGGRGVPGTKRLRFVLTTRIHDEATDSGAEYELLFHMQRAGIPLPELHFEFVVQGRRIIVDLYWPVFRKAVEVDGIDAHSSADRLDDDLNRQNLLLELGVELRRFSARRIRREPELVIAQIRRFLEA